MKSVHTLLTGNCFTCQVGVDMSVIVETKSVFGILQKFAQEKKEA